MSSVAKACVIPLAAFSPSCRGGGSRGVGRRTTQSFSFRSLSASPRFARASPLDPLAAALRAFPCSPRPDRSGTFGDFGRLRPSALPASFGSSGRSFPRGHSAPPQVVTSGRLPSSATSSAKERPRRSTGRSDLGRAPRFRQESRTGLKTPEPGVRVNPGRRRRPRPTSRRLMSAPLGWTRRKGEKHGMGILSRASTSFKKARTP
jgi:hypothetical protein